MVQWIWQCILQKIKAGILKLKLTRVYSETATCSRRWKLYKRNQCKCQRLCASCRQWKMVSYVCSCSRLCPRRGRQWQDSLSHHNDHLSFIWSSTLDIFCSSLGHYARALRIFACSLTRCTKYTIVKRLACSPGSRTARSSPQQRSEGYASSSQSYSGYEDRGSYGMPGPVPLHSPRHAATQCIADRPFVCVP